MSVKIKSVNLMPVNNKVRKKYRQFHFQPGFSDISDLRLVDNCLKMTGIGGNESKTAYLDAQNDE